MSIHILSTALLLALAVALILGLKVGAPGDRKPTPPPSPATVTTARSERVVVMPTAGGRLEVATVTARETLTRSDPKVLFDFIDLGTTMSEVRVDATYRYHVETARAWPLRIVGRTCLVRAGAVRPTLPVAFDTSTVERRTASGWARFDKAESLEVLERSLTQQLADRAPIYRQQAREAGRAVVAEFVAEWLLREQRWRRDPEHRVVVVFADEAGPAARAASGPSYLKGSPEDADDNKSLWRRRGDEKLSTPQPSGGGRASPHGPFPLPLTDPRFTRIPEGVRVDLT